jgi:hypothetical protein
MSGPALILRRAQPRKPGELKPDDYDVFDGDRGVGRIYLVHECPLDEPSDDRQQGEGQARERLTQQSRPWKFGGLCHTPRRQSRALTCAGTRAFLDTLSPAGRIKPLGRGPPGNIFGTRRNGSPAGDLN